MTAKISREDLKAKIDRNDEFVLVDTLPETAYRKGHLPGAISIVSDDIIDVAPERIPDRDTYIVVYCSSGTCKRSSFAAERLERLGYTCVRDYHEGKADWVEAGLPFVTD
ncbi:MULTISPECIES: rhodanese-like domain-containing protein [Leisingera]|jgi:rhodanese-related sulfurtransferase|uniref:rhodanese-like domain-containing protein n=1 Tax=Leisingera TaxID=191028 RepID=UPI000B0A4C4D|nr:MULTISPECIES: rhodanese-like domain-containing protein [Leisingera]QDI74499.1 rhodanese-like domain-containing protein [Leisingera aquaemixtae]